jgi:hypothetical protein
MWKNQTWVFGGKTFLLMTHSSRERKSGRLDLHFSNILLFSFLVADNVRKITIGQKDFKSHI